MLPKENALKLAELLGRITTSYLTGACDDELAETAWCRRIAENRKHVACIAVYN
jgi:hypothetical protein